MKAMQSAMRSRHADFIDWCRLNNVALKQLRALRAKEEKGFVAYFNDIRDFFKDYRANKRKRAEGKEVVKADATESSALYQHAASQELLRKMKWKRISWEDSADYHGFARRIMDNDDMFKRVPAFSFMNLKVVKDPSNISAVKTHLEGSFKAGDLTSWCCAERVPAVLPPYKTPAPGKLPYSINWQSGEAHLLDSISPPEVLTFLNTTANQLQAAQVRIEEFQAAIVADVEHARVRTGLLRLKYNEYDASYWEDPLRATNPDYVTPEHVRMFLDGVLRGAFFYRWFLSGHEVRIVHPNQPYRVDLERKQLHIPANFSDFNWVPLHKKAASFERMLNACRTVWYLWFALGVMIVGGDLDLF